MEKLEALIFKRYITELKTQNPHAFENLPATTQNATIEQLAFRYDVFLLDAFGTLYNHNHFVYPGALSMFRYLKSKGKPVRLVTNAASKPIELLLKDLWLMGFDFRFEDVFSSGSLLIENNQKWKHTEALYIGKDTGASFLEAAGIQSNADTMNPVVIVSSVSQDKTLILKAKNLLKKEGAVLIVLNPDPWAPTPDAKRVPVCGAFAQYLAEDSQAKIHYLGKPFPELFHKALAAFSKQNKAIMIGDTLGTDILGATVAGIDTALVLGRNTPIETVSESENILGIRPHYYLKGF